MFARWVICPVITEIVDRVTYRRPKVGKIIDPGRSSVKVTTWPEATRENPTAGTPVIETVAKFYGFSAIISDGILGQVNDWCLVLVAGVDLSALDSDPSIESLIEADADADFLDLTMDDLGQNQQVRRLERPPFPAADSDCPGGRPSQGSQIALARRAVSLVHKTAG